jgi:nitrite reductase (NO-forming)
MKQDGSPVLLVKEVVMVQALVERGRGQAVPGRSADALRIGFGVIWLVDAGMKWLPGFRSGMAGMISDAAQGQPGFLMPWFRLWNHLVGPHAVLFAYLVAMSETLIAVALLAGFARRVSCAGAIVFSLMIWSVAEGFGGPYGSGSTDIGTGIIYAVVFAGLLVIARHVPASRLTADYHLQQRLGWWHLLSGSPAAVPARPSVTALPAVPALTARRRAA